MTFKGTLPEINTAVDNLKTIENVVHIGTPMRRGGETDYFVVIEIEVHDDVHYID
ncbi:hypothetical protein HQK17_28115 [Bacillus cereus]|uniref:hypothetical protein n=1 Tax=Bacillus cereus TaxID=1396 RepID=UPI00156A8EF6|nr:hypothetical protein [Bacillus cereus]NRQ71988.1 hypothetical protein [Bacillus cereus]